MKKTSHKEIAQQIRAVIKGERLFHDINLSRKMVTERVGIGNTLLSQIMEEEFGMSLPKYISKCRAEYAMKIMKSKSHTENTLDEIALLSGFQSRSALHRAFVHFYGMAPGKVRET